jgi:hypothetical protein
MKQKLTKDLIIKNYGIGNSSSIKLHKILGLNLRKSPIHVLNKHKKKINSFYSKKIINNELKRTVNTYLETKKRIQPIKIKGSIVKKK